MSSKYIISKLDIVVSMNFVTGQGHFFGQGMTQVWQLVLAYILAAIIGLERQYRGKSAGLRTHTIVGVAAALYMIVSKYGFQDILSLDHSQLTLDPSRVAAQVVSGIGFLGAGLIITRRHIVEGLTTAASIWSVAAIGMACAGNLPILAIVVVILHFVSSTIMRPVGEWFSAKGKSGRRQLTVTYHDGQGIMRRILEVCDENNWTIYGFDMKTKKGSKVLDDDENPVDMVEVCLVLKGINSSKAAMALLHIDGVVNVEQDTDD
ncbi:MAG: MgtC/SapB family protein [Micrococcaceae bacterium]